MKPAYFLIQNLWERNLERCWGLSAFKWNYVGDTPEADGTDDIWPMLDVHLETPEQTFTEALMMLYEQGIEIPSEFELYLVLRKMQSEKRQENPREPEMEIFHPETVKAWYLVKLEEAKDGYIPKRTIRETTGSAVLWWLATFPEMLSKYEGIPIILDGYLIEGQRPALLIKKREDNRYRLQIIRWSWPEPEDEQRFWLPVLCREIFPLETD